MAKSKKRNLFGEMMEGVRAMRGHREGRITLRSHHITPLSLPSIDEQTIRNTRERLHMSRSAFAHRLKPRANRVKTVRHICRLPEPNRDALVICARFIGDTTDGCAETTGFRLEFM